MKVVTKSGFACEVNEEKIQDWRFIKALALCDSDDESEALQGVTRAVPFLFGKKGEEELIDFVAKKNNGIAKTAEIISMLKEVLPLLSDEIKKSGSSQE